MSGYAAEMHVRNNVRMLYSRMQTLLNRRSKQKRTIEIVSFFSSPETHLSSLWSRVHS